MATSAPSMLATGVTAELYRAAIGPRGQDYYLRHFMRFDANGKAGATWHWPAYCCTFNWLLYRKMWGWALGYVGTLLGLALLIFGVGKLVFDYSDSSALVLFLGLLTAAFVVPALYANAWFYRHCNERITAALRSTGEVKDACEILKEQAPDNRRWLGLVGVNVALLAAVLGAVNWFQETAGDPAVLASHDAPAVTGGLSGQAKPPVIAPRMAAAPAAAASAPAVSAAPAAPASAAVAAAAPVTSPSPTGNTGATPAAPAADAAAASARPAPATAAVVDTKAAAAKAPVMVSAADRAPTPVRPEPAALPARAPRDAARAPAAASDVANADAPAPSVAAKASAPATTPRVRHVWVVQVGAYAQAENAKNALAQVQSLGLDAGAEVFDSPKGPLTRVRVGPYTRQAEAEQAALRIKTLNLPVLVIRQRP